MKIAIAQFNPTIGDIAGNAQKLLELAQTAAANNATLLVTPELALCGYPPRDLLLYPGFITGLHKSLTELAQQLPHSFSALIGTATANPQPGQRPLHNSLAWLHNGQVQQYYHKRLLPTYDVFDEARYFQPGTDQHLIKLNGITLGVTICEDLWNDEDYWGKRQYAINPLADLGDADLIINLSASPYCVGKQATREDMLRHSARRYHQPIIYVNQVGGNDDLIFDGASLALNAQGNLVLRSQAFVETLDYVEFEPSTQTLTANTLAPAFADPAAEIWSALVLGVKDYARKCGFTKAVLGLSGGIDSALVAAIAQAALGAENVLGVLMPSPYSSDGSLTDAIALVKNLGIQSQTLPIEPGMGAYDQILNPLFANTEFGVAEENIQSRLRGGILMAIANKFGYLLLSTGNKSELAVGYCTLYGDMNGGLAVIADLPKTSVYTVCRWLNRQQSTIPEEILTKPPSAELRPGQKDADSLPSYDLLDDLLEQLLVKHRSPADLIQTGYDSAIVQQIAKLLQRAEFKRRQAPPGLKVTDRAFGTGWRMPIASRWILG